jgi:hypothetical protein
MVKIRNFKLGADIGICFEPFDSGAVTSKIQINTHGKARKHQSRGARKSADRPRHIYVGFLNSSQKFISSNPPTPHLTASFAISKAEERPSNILE